MTESSFSCLYLLLIPVYSPQMTVERESRSPSFSGRRLRKIAAMPRLGQLVLETVPRVAVAVDDVEVHNQPRQALRLADVLELRIDTFTRHDPHYIAEVAAAAGAYGIPLLATVRAANEGGTAQLT